jgi:hypothetical protein
MEGDIPHRFQKMKGVVAILCAFNILGGPAFAASCTWPMAAPWLIKGSMWDFRSMEWRPIWVVLKNETDAKL